MYPDKSHKFEIFLKICVYYNVSKFIIFYTRLLAWSFILFIQSILFAAQRIVEQFFNEEITIWGKRYF